MITVWTIGHSTRTAEDFIAMLTAHGIELLIDVRAVPRSRHNPQFDADALPASLGAAAIEYLHMPGLGGLRHPKKDSTNTAWKNDSFRGYADYMQTPVFAGYLEELIEAAGHRRVAMMCAEAVPWRCHRSLIGDALMAGGLTVRHILSATSDKPHSVTFFCQIDGERVTYPGLPVPTIGEDRS